MQISFLSNMAEFVCMMGHWLYTFLFIGCLLESSLWLHAYLLTLILCSFYRLSSVMYHSVLDFETRGWAPRRISSSSCRAGGWRLWWRSHYLQGGGYRGGDPEEDYHLQGVEQEEGALKKTTIFKRRQEGGDPEEDHHLQKLGWGVKTLKKISIFK